jgi:hypothetical protein
VASAESFSSSIGTALPSSPTFQRAILVGIYLFYAGAKTTARRQRVDLELDGLGRAEHRGVGRDSQPHDRHSPYISGIMHACRGAAYVQIWAGSQLCVATHHRPMLLAHRRGSVARVGTR